MNKIELCSLKILAASSEISNAIYALKFIQTTLPLKDFIKINESINQLEEHKIFLLNIEKDIISLG